MSSDRLPKPEVLVKKLNDLHRRYVRAIQQLLDIYPQYASAPTVSGRSELFAEKTGDLQQVEADLFMLRNKTEGAMVEAAEQTAKLEKSLEDYEKVDKKLAGRLDALDMQLLSADGRLRDTVFLYREAYLSNCLLASSVLWGVYYTYKSVFGAS